MKRTIWSVIIVMLALSICGLATAESIKWNSGSYVGDVVDSVPNGSGRLSFSNGDTYMGKWVNGSLNGYGEYHSRDGSSYRGEWRDGKRNGYGISIDASGNRRIGVFISDVFAHEVTIPADIVDRIFAGHVLLSAKSSKKPEGKILWYVVFVNNGGASRGESRRKAYIAKLENNVRFLVEEAARYRVEIIPEFASVCIESDVFVNDRASQGSYKKMMRAAGLPAMQPTAEAQLKKQYGADHVLITFAFVRADRAFSWDRLIFMYQDDGPIVHETLHTFGALDYYGSQKIKTAVYKYYSGDSIMMYGGGVDSLTAYLIGWADPDLNAINMLLDTESISINQFWSDLDETKW